MSSREKPMKAAQRAEERKGASVIAHETIGCASTPSRDAMLALYL